MVRMKMEYIFALIMIAHYIFETYMESQLFILVFKNIVKIDNFNNALPFF